MIDFARVTHLTFDCYGTLIDWEEGILEAVAPVLRRHEITASDEVILRLYTKLEAEQESGPYKPYRDVLRGVMSGLAAELRFNASAADLDVLPDSVGRWPRFADTAAALQRLSARYQLVILSNIDDALFARTAPHLEVQFSDIITAQQVGAYKPSPEYFHFALNRLGVPAGQVLHVAQSLYHDHVPAKRLGLTTVWVRRPSRLPGTGLALPAEVRPDLEVVDLQGLAQMAGIAALPDTQSST
jgi:2-haloacid dehalogenase